MVSGEKNELADVKEVRCFFWLYFCKTSEAEVGFACCASAALLQSIKVKRKATKRVMLVGKKG